MLTWTESHLDADSWAVLWGDAPMPLQQSAIYGDALSAFRVSPRRLVLTGDDEEPVAALQIMERRAFGFMTVAVAFWGPHWRATDLNEQMKFEALRSLQHSYPKLRGRFLSIMPHAPDGDADTTALMHRLGLRRTITGYGTVWLDLSADEEALRANLKGKWRNALVTAEKSTLQVQEGGSKPHHYAWLIEREDAQRLDVRYSGLPTEFIALYGAHAAETKAHGVFSLAATANGERVAGQLYLLHGNTATYMVGWNGEEGRRYSAHNLLTWQAMRALKQKGLRYIDMGGLNTEADGAGIARFKLGLGAPPYIYAGTFA